MRFHHIAFVCALVCAAFAWASPTSWDRHALLALLAIGFCVLGLALAAAARAPIYDADWCHHDPRCGSHDWHAVLVGRECTNAEVSA